MNLVCAFGLTLVTTSATTSDLTWKFSPEGWKPSEWIMVKSPYSPYVGKWVQKKEAIENAVPSGASPEELQGKLAHDTYASMVYHQPFSGNLKVSTTTEFDYQMAPIIVLAQKIEKNQAGRMEYREYYEVCIYDKGVNIWRHSFVDGKPVYQRAAYACFPLNAKTRYRLEVEKNEKEIIVKIDGHELGYTESHLTGTYYVGVTGCEGLNRFYDFRIHSDSVKTK